MLTKYKYLHIYEDSFGAKILIDDCAQSFEKCLYATFEIIVQFLTSTIFGFSIHCKQTTTTMMMSVCDDLLPTFHAMTLSLLSSGFEMCCSLFLDQL